MEDIIIPISQIGKQINGISLMINSFQISKNRTFLMNALEAKKDGEAMATLEEESI